MQLVTRWCVRGVPTAALVVALCVTAEAQEHRAVAFGSVGLASIGHADSEQGTAPIVGGGLAFLPVPWLGLEADVHGARVRNVFGRAFHDFTSITVTGSLLLRTRAGARAHVLAGGGVAWQRVHSEFELAPAARVDRTDTVRLLHGRAGVEWEVSNRIVLRTEAVVWFGPGLDWVVGGRLGAGYRF